MTLDPLAGMVVVLAGPTAEATVDLRSWAVPTGAELLARGALLAAVTTDADVIDDLCRNAELHSVDPPLSWRADPADPATWERLYQHIEQRLGPVDAVVADPAALHLVEQIFRPDMHRRGHGAIVSLGQPEDPLTAIRRLLRHTP